MEIAVIKTKDGFIPLDEVEAERLLSIKNGSIIRANFTHMRNGAFHRKWFALLKFAFDNWEPPEVPGYTHNGIVVKKNFDSFREDVLKWCGFYEPVFVKKGPGKNDYEVRKKATSISFAKMDEDTFRDVYKNTIQVLLEHFLHHLTYDEFKPIAETILSYEN